MTRLLYERQLTRRYGESGFKLFDKNTRNSLGAIWVNGVGRESVVCRIRRLHYLPASATVQ